jgi:glutathione synthase/RimK-type ligase-like ATP-grasp enzyme
MNVYTWRARWLRLKETLRRRLPPALRRWAKGRLGIGRDRWAARRQIADTEPLVEHHRHTRPSGRLRHRIGVTVAPDHPDAVPLRAAAAELGGEVHFFDPDAPHWAESVLGSGLDGHLVRLRHATYVERGLDDARLALLHLEGVPAWPTPAEAFLYEDKARAAWLLAARGVPHVPTLTFIRFADAEAYLSAADYPLVMKTRIGAGGSGVERLENVRSALALARACLDGRWQRRAADPRDADFGYLTVQPFIADAREHRVIRLGETYFAHGKVRAPGGWRYSGSGSRDWELPGVHVLDAGAEVMDRLGMTCGAVDILEQPDGRWAVLEAQAWYEGFRAAQMDVDGVPTIAKRTASGWSFETAAPHIHRGHALRLLAFDDYLGERLSGRLAAAVHARPV